MRYSEILKIYLCCLPLSVCDWLKIRNFEDLLSHLFDSFDPSEKAELEKKREQEKKSIKIKDFLIGSAGSLLWPPSTLEKASMYM